MATANNPERSRTAGAPVQGGTDAEKKFAQKTRNASENPAHNEEELGAEEGDIFYDDDFMDDDDGEQPGIRELIEQLEAMRPDDDLYDTITRNEQTYQRHERDEEYELYPLVKKTKTGTTALGEKLLQRKIAMMAELALADELEESSASTNSKKKSKRGFVRVLP